MSTLTLSGPLGERYKHFNESVKKACTEKKIFEELHDFHPKTDMESLLKIDAANHFKNVEYIFDVLKCDDNLLKSRAMKCNWLFEGILLPEISRLSNLRDNLFPHISNYTKCKIIHNLSISLKNESLAEEYFEYFRSNDNNQHAWKFLPACSIDFIIEALSTKDVVLTETQLLKISEKHFELSYAYFSTKDKRRSLKNGFSKVVSLMASTDASRFLDWFEGTLYPEGISVKLGARSTSKIMKTHKERVIRVIEKYKTILNRQAIVEALSSDDVREVLLKLLPQDESAIPNESKLFLAYTKKMSQQEQLTLFKNIYMTMFKKEPPMDGSLFQLEWKNILNLDAIQKWALDNVNNKTPWSSGEQPRLFIWYSYVDFEIAFPRLRELVKSEPQAKERMNMLTVMIDSYCRRNREDDLSSLLQYYFKFHLNEQHRSDFLAKLLNCTVIYKYSEKSWSIIDEIFHNFDVYNESKPFGYAYNIYKCLNEVIRRHLLKNTLVPENVLKLYISGPNYEIHNKDVTDIKFEEMVFDTVVGALLHKFDSLNYDENKDDKEGVFFLVVDYIQKWNQVQVKNKRSIAQYPSVLEFIKANKDIRMYTMSNYLRTDKDFIRHIVHHLLMNHVNEDLLLYCLKHHYDLLNDPDKDILNEITGSWTRFKRFYRKLRVYFADDLAIFWIQYYLKAMEDSEFKSFKLQNTVYGLSILLEQDKYLNVIEPYKPVDAKIKWSEIDKNILERSQLIAKYSHLVRPLLKPEIILTFTKGDYLQYILTSLMSLCHHYDIPTTKKVVLTLIDNPVSVQKHGIRLLFNSFGDSETTSVIMDIWSKTKNASIRFVILQNLVRFMKKPLLKSTREKYWHCLKEVIGQLFVNNDELFEHLAANVGGIHVDIFSEYCECVWEALVRHKSYQAHLLSVLKVMNRRQIHLSGDFCGKLITNYIENNFVNESVFEKADLSELDNEMITFIVKYLLCIENDSEQNERICLVYELLTKYLKSIWNTNRSNAVKAKKYYEIFLKTILLESFNVYAEFVNSKKLLNHILADMSTFLPISEGFNRIIVTKLVCFHHEIFEPVRKIVVEYDADLKPELLKIISDSWQMFGRRSGDLLNELIGNYFPQIYTLFVNVFGTFVRNYLNYGCFNRRVTENYLLLNIAKGLFSHESHIYPLLLGIQILPTDVGLDKLSKPLHEHMLKSLQESKQPEVTFFLNTLILTGK